MRRTALGIGLAIAIIGEPALARDRPETPLAVEVSETDRDSLDTKPRLFVTLYNRSDDVHFWWEWTANGEPQPKDFERSCGDLDPDRFICAWPHLQGPDRPDPIETDNDIRHLAMMLKELEFDTEYCFKFMAQHEDGLTSPTWSEWACTRTRQPPPLPDKPTVTQVAVLPAKTGQGEIGGAVPARVLVEWTGNRDTTANYSVERMLESGWTTRTSGIRRDLDPLEVAVPVGADPLPTFERPVRYRVCAWNISGKTCSDGVSTETYAAEEKIDPDLVVKPTEPPAETRRDTDAMTAPTVPPADVLRPGPYQAPPAAEPMRRGPFTAPTEPVIR
jgi:hypothetical protein